MNNIKPFRCESCGSYYLNDKTVYPFGRKSKGRRIVKCKKCNSMKIKWQ